MSTPQANGTSQGTTRSAAPRKRKRRNPDGSMSLAEHIAELRHRILVSLVAFSIATVLGFLWYQHSVFGLISLGEILRGPYCQLDPSIRADISPDGTCKLLSTKPFEMFMLRLKVGALAGTVLSSPVWLAQIWGFVTPGLLKNERRWTATFVSIAVGLFVIGAVLAYFVMAYGLEMLLQMGSNVAITALSGSDYYSFFLALLLIFGVSFEVPLLLAMLNIAGVVAYDDLKDKRSAIIIIIFVFAAFITPGQDPFSMTALAVALCVLVELSLQFARINDKRRNRQRPAWMDVDDDSAAPLEPAGPAEAGPAETSQAGASPASASAYRPAPSTLEPPQPINHVRANQELGDLGAKDAGAFDDVL